MNRGKKQRQEVARQLKAEQKREARKLRRRSKASSSKPVAGLHVIP
jgi:hypothetical protein